MESLSCKDLLIQSANNLLAMVTNYSKRTSFILNLDFTNGFLNPYTKTYITSADYISPLVDTGRLLSSLGYFFAGSTKSIGSCTPFLDSQSGEVAFLSVSDASKSNIPIGSTLSDLSNGETLTLWTPYFTLFASYT